jgi:hypothetical protein
MTHAGQGEISVYLDGVLLDDTAGKGELRRCGHELVHMVSQVVTTGPETGDAAHHCAQVGGKETQWKAIRHADEENGETISEGQGEGRDHREGNTNQKATNGK